MRVLCLLLLVLPLWAQPRVHYFVGDRIKVLEETGNTRWSRPGLVTELVTKAAAAGCAGIVGLDQWSKGGDPADDPELAARMHEICRLCDSLGLELRPQVWNGSKFPYGAPDGLWTKHREGYVVPVNRGVVLESGQRVFLPVEFSGDLSSRLFDLELLVSGGAVELEFLRRLPDDLPASGRYVLGPERMLQRVTFHSLAAGGPYLIKLTPASADPAKVFVRRFSERGPEPKEVFGQTVTGGYLFVGSRESSYFYSRTMTPDSTRVFYERAMAPSRTVWREFADEPAIRGVWANLDEVFVLGDHGYAGGRTAGEAFRDMVEAAAWYNYSLWGEPLWGWNDQLGGHNSKPAVRAATGMETSGVGPDVPFLGFVWGEAHDLRGQLMQFAPGTVGLAGYLGVDSPDSLAVLAREFRCPEILLFGWDYDYADSLEMWVNQIRGN